MYFLSAATVLIKEAPKYTKLMRAAPAEEKRAEDDERISRLINSSLLAPSPSLHSPALN